MTDDDDGKKDTGKRGEFVKGLERSFLLLFAGACLVFVAILIWGLPTHIGSHSFPLWVMFFVAGIVAVGGGLLAALVPGDEEEKPESTEKYVVVARAKWNSTMEELANLRTLSKEVTPASSKDKTGSPSSDKSPDTVATQDTRTEAPEEAPSIATEARPPVSKRARKRRKARERVPERSAQTGDDVQVQVSK